MKKISDNSLSILSHKQAIEILKPHHSNIYGSIHDGWEAWERFGQLAPELRKPLDATARANFVYCSIVDSAKRRFRDKDGVRVEQKRRVLSLIFFGKIALRFKKLDRRLRSRALPTQRYLEFISQLCFPGLEQTKLIGGYRLDDLEAALEDIHVTCPLGSRNIWSYELSLGIQLPIVSITPESSEEKPRVRSTMRIKEQKKQAK